MLKENNFHVFKKFFHILIKKGKKTKALNMTLKSFNKLKFNKAINLPMKKIIEKSFKNIKPLLHVKKIRRSSRVFYFPKLITEEQKTSLSLHWLIKSINFRKERKLEERIEKEFLDCFFSKGSTVYKKQSLYDIIMANRPFLNLLLRK